MVFCEPTTNTIAHEKNSTTTVRKAVARSEGTLRIPHFAKIAVTPAKSADKNARHSHINLRFLSFSSVVPKNRFVNSYNCFFCRNLIECIHSLFLKDFDVPADKTNVRRVFLFIKTERRFTGDRYGKTKSNRI